MPYPSPVTPPAGGTRTTLHRPCPFGGSASTIEGRSPLGGLRPGVQSASGNPGSPEDMGGPQGQDAVLLRAAG